MIRPGTRFGPFEILDSLGAGGQGEVYRAKDTRLNRTVAIKVLPGHLNDQPELRQRFEQEARAIAALSHPHICVLYDIGQHEGIDFLVMEYLEGETLAERLARGGLSLNQVLRYASEMADALDKAHRRGVVHRDLKPGNIIITRAGVKLLDFGLAKLLRGDSVPLAEVSGSDTPGQPLTRAGAVLGTPHYMAPEQLEGKEADARADLFAFGAVVYEMATGRKAFEGGSPASLIAAILEHDPQPMSALAPLTPWALERTVKACLAKNPDDRWQTAHDLLRELKWIGEEGPSAPATTSQRSRERLAWSLAAVLLLGLVASMAFIGLWARPSPAADVAIRFSASPPANVTFTSFETAGVTPQLALSPDGRYLAFVGSRAGGPPLLWVRPLESLDAQALPGTEEASFPFWSPDSRFIGFFVPGKLKKIDVAGRLPQPLADVPAGRGGTWNRDGVILFANNLADGLYQVSAAGGPITFATTLDASREETSHRWPQFLSDGRHFLYFVRGRADGAGIHVGSLDTREETRLLIGDVAGGIAASGYLLTVREGSLMAQPLNPKSVQLEGQPFLVAEGVASGSPTGLTALSASETGVLAYAAGVTPNRELVWFDRSGRQLASVGERGEYSHPSLSRDEKWIAVQRMDSRTRNIDIWLLDLARGASNRFTFDDSNDRGPVWSPDGGHIVFASNRAGPWNLYRKGSSGASSDELLTESSRDMFPTDWSEDGRFVVYHVLVQSTGWDIWVLPLTGDRRPTPFLQTEFTEVQAAISPDGKWIAYASDESGAFEIYVRPFPASGNKWRVSTHGGFEPRWRQNGTELYYLTPDGKLMAAPISVRSGFQAGVPEALFEARVPGTTIPFPASYAVAANGQRFLFNTVADDATSAPATVVVHWTAELKKE